MVAGWYRLSKDEIAALERFRAAHGVAWQQILVRQFFHRQLEGHLRDATERLGPSSALSHFARETRV